MSYKANIGIGYGLGRLFRNAEISIINSHLAALKFAQAEELDEIIIVEDDIVMCEDWSKRIDKLKELLPINWEFVYLSGHSDYTNFQQINEPQIIQAPKMSGAFSYMVNYTAYSKIIGFCQSYLTTFDDLIMNMISLKKLNAFTYFPFVTYHSDNWSTLWEEESKNHSSKKFFKNKI
jgi:GR25 family glycosyltransferase involved in LPS biosynthesis